MVFPSQDQPVTTTTPDLDGFYQLAWKELGLNTVSFIRDESFNHNQPIPCPVGGCFQAGQKWTYVWTRDTSYAVDLALAPLQADLVQPGAGPQQPVAGFALAAQDGQAE
jgi:hypothetical protein